MSAMLPAILLRSSGRDFRAEARKERLLQWAYVALALACLALMIIVPLGSAPDVVAL